MIIKKIEEIILKEGKSIIVLKGFKDINLSDENKYFSFSIEHYDKVDLEVARAQVVDDIIENREFTNDYKWMTIEEYQLFKENQNLSKMPIVILDNNLYYKQYPFNFTLSNVSNAYHYLYYQEDVELESKEQKLMDNVSFFYGKIDYSKQSGNYYVTYPEIPNNIKIYKLYNEENVIIKETENYPESDIIRIELSDDEMPFLDLISDTLVSEKEVNVLLILSGDEETLPNNYLSRINILKELRKIKVYFSTLSIRRQFIENEQEYLKILNEVYGHDNFRELDFYKNIENRSKETINISQAQIIDDIVIQAEKAMHGEPFQDIYITSSTGSGKSVMFQIPAFYLAEKYSNNKPLTLVISPLIGLMEDQVGSMIKKGVDSSATINGNTLPYERERILERIQNQEVNVLYLSPETLQARSDIKMLIGERSIGVVIIDEAHIVTTWGKSFRADYWYLGIYLAKLRKEYAFPIVTFTATSIYGGKEDMYLDTRNSLNMISPISYFGKVRRDDIIMNVRSSEKEFKNLGSDYRKTKNVLALKHILDAEEKNQKSLLYFPTVRLLLDFYNFAIKNKPELKEKLGRYYGTLNKEEKDEALKQFNTGEIQFVLATKAFGMGIDISDITNVYHYAPTGNVVDYIQEIGRAARDKDKVEYGFGSIDFLSKDFNEVKKLHGMSAIRKPQILEVMQKVLSVYKEKGYNRNLIISPEDFNYIFVQTKRDEETLDNKVKTVLLMIEKDFASPQKLGYSPFVARPRSLFGNDLVFVSYEFEKEILKSPFARFFKKVHDINSKLYTSIYEVNLSGIWENHYRHMTYPSFKYSLFTKGEKEKLKHYSLFKKFIYTSGIELIISDDLNSEDILAQYRIILKSYEEFINNNKITGKHFTINELGNHFMKSLKISDKFESRAFAQAIINASFEFSKLKDIKFISERHNYSSNESNYIIHHDGDIFTNFIYKSLSDALVPTDNYIVNLEGIISYYYRTSHGDVDARITALGIGQARKILTYQLNGGNNPQIYLRMNSVYPLEAAIKQGNYYQNSILDDVQNKHYISVAMLTYLFKKEKEGSTVKEQLINYTEWFWNNIEDYFMGIIPSKVKEELIKNKNN